MLLQCEMCQTKVKEIAKVPCGFSYEREGKNLVIIFPNNEDAYRNICLACLLKI